MKGPAPACRSIAVMDDGPLLAQLEDIVPLQRLLTTVGEYKDSILMALESLEAREGQIETKTVRNGLIVMSSCCISYKMWFYCHTQCNNRVTWGIRFAQSWCLRYPI